MAVVRNRSQRITARTSILTATARAFGLHEPDASVRNPDWVADRLIGPAALALIAGIPSATLSTRIFRKPFTTRCLHAWS
jgi:hypothetical protein